MSIRDSITRQSLIIDILRKGSATLKQIAARLKREAEIKDYRLDVSPRTFKRDLDEIFTLHNIEIKFDFSKKVYRIIDDNQPEVKSRLLEVFNTFQALSIADDLSDYIHFEKRKPKGTEHLYGLLHAIKNRLVITFTFQDFWEDEKHRRTLEPFALKEFKNRWYVLAKDAADGKVKRFGLDRLTDLEITKKVFEHSPAYDVDAIYRDCFGIITSDETEPSEIILSFDGYQGKYIKSLPLHESQEVILDTNEELQIKLKLFITHDLIMELLSYGETVKVIKPEKLRIQIKCVLETALKYYS